MNRHVIEAMGKTRVVIEDGKVTDVGKPLVSYCPLFRKYRGIQEINSSAVKNNIEFRMKSFGMCTPHRELRIKDFLSFGVSEIIAMAVSKNMLDCAVVVCEGAGTVVVSDPELIQGIGGRLSAVIETTPYSEIINALGRDFVLDPRSGKIDQFEGVCLADRLGFRKIGVTVVSADEASKIRVRFGERAAIFAVHTTGASKDDALRFFDACDIVTACASRWVREVAAERALFAVGRKIPVYAATEFGKALMLERLAMIPHKTNEDDRWEDCPHPLI